MVVKEGTVSENNSPFSAQEQASIDRFLAEHENDIKTKGGTLLHQALDNRNIAVAKYLISEGVNIKTKDKDGKTPLHKAINDLALAELLIEAGADVKAKDKGGNTALHWVAFRGNAEVAKFLVSKNASVKVLNDNRETPLAIARRQVNFGVIQYLESIDAR